MPECQNARRGLVHIWASPSAIIHHHGSAWRLALSGQSGGVLGFSLRARGLRCGAKDRLGSCCSGPVSMLHGAAHQRPSRDGGARGGLFDWPGGGRWSFSVMAWAKRTRMPSGRRWEREPLDAAKPRGDCFNVGWGSDLHPSQAVDCQGGAVSPNNTRPRPARRLLYRPRHRSRRTCAIQGRRHRAARASVPAARKGKGARNMVNFLEEETEPFKPRQRPLFIVELC